jgi:hypothetical protein
MSKALYLLDRDVVAERSLNVSEEPLLATAYEREGQALRPGPSGTPDTVDIVFGDVWEIEVHYVRQVLYVESARGYIGGHERPYRASLKVAKRLCTGRLALVAVYGGRAYAVL